MYFCLYDERNREPSNVMALNIDNKNTSSTADGQEQSHRGYNSTIEGAKGAKPN